MAGLITEPFRGPYAGRQLGQAGSCPACEQDSDETVWNYSLDVNLTAHYRTCHVVTPGVIERRWGRIVNIGSVNARAGRSNLVAYSTAKAGLLGLPRSLAREPGPYGICVNTVMAGGIQVEAENTFPAQHRARPADRIKRQCVPRRGRPEDVAALVAFLVGPCPPRSSRGSPSTSTAVGCCTETTNKQGHKPK
ncbi:SDR family oxidoreductase [Streptomyces sp. NPDC059814]|uniref:SDR family oxidoreductase n=1 Tax=Streptomyces sp. NPDC059814 TaxID=3346959 RepID=UPI0036552DBC